MFTDLRKNIVIMNISHGSSSQHTCFFDIFTKYFPIFPSSTPNKSLVRFNVALVSGLFGLVIGLIISMRRNVADFEVKLGAVYMGEELTGEKSEPKAYTYRGTAVGFLHKFPHALYSYTCTFRLHTHKERHAQKL